ncbi:hypothetical protein ABPG72_006605 [Tetrahymena utriculariae]
MKKIAINYIFNQTLGRQNHVRVIRLSAPKAIYNFSNKEDILNGLNEKDYQRYCSQFLNELGDILEESPSQRISDVQISDGVIKVTTQGEKIFVINRQVPNRQIWYSSPVSGPQRFYWDLQEAKWKNQKNEELSKLLFKEIDQI